MRIQHKFIAIFFLTSAFLVVAQVLIMQWSIGKGMIDYVNQKELDALNDVAVTLSELYEKDGSWQKIKDDHRRFKIIIDRGLANSEFSELDNSRPPRPQGPRSGGGFRDNGPPQGPPNRYQRPNGPDFENEDIPMFEASYALLDENRQSLAGLYSDKIDYSFIEINVEQQNVGFLAVSKRNKLIAGYELNFVKQQQRYIFLIALFLVIVAMAIALPLAAHFITPIKRLAGAMNKLISGDYKQRINLKRKDEFAQLSRDFNELAQTLEKNEDARKRWLADISHELRTPVAVLKGEVEAILDGVRPLTIERIHSANDEVKQLEKLLDDLHELTRNDLGTLHYRKEAIGVADLIRTEVNHYQPLLKEQNIDVSFGNVTEHIQIFADPRRLKQLFGNLFINVSKYAIDGNILKISIEPSNNVNVSEVRITIEDNGLGVDDAHLPMLFEHLFRVENSRNRETGGSGLGLSICKKIVEAHHGTISAFASELGGLGILIVLPTE